MQHFPSDEQKATLAGIAADEQADKDLRIIACAVGNVALKVPDDERVAPQGLVDDPAAKTLASAALRFNHQLSAEDKAALQALIG